MKKQSRRGDVNTNFHVTFIWTAAILDSSLSLSTQYKTKQRISSDRERRLLLFLC